MDHADILHQFADGLDAVAKNVGEVRRMDFGSEMAKVLSKALRAGATALQSAENSKVHLAEISEALDDPSLTSLSQVATGIRDLREALAAEQGKKLCTAPVSAITTKSPKFCKGCGCKLAEYLGELEYHHQRCEFLPL